MMSHDSKRQPAVGKQIGLKFGIAPRQAFGANTVTSREAVAG